MTTTLNLWQRIALAQSKVDYIQKEKKAGMNYSIVSHDAVTAKVRPVLVDCGIACYPIGLQSTQEGNRTQVQLTMRFINIDAPTEFFDVPSLGYGIDTQDKGPGKAISYAVKYALLKTLGLETGDDPDLDQDVKHEPEAKSKPAQAYDRNPIVKAEFERINKGINTIGQTGNIEDLTAWYKTNLKSIEGMPADWNVLIMDNFSETKEQLKAKAA